MTIKQLGKHDYGQDGFVWQVSPDALAEKCNNWHEIEGAAAGYAIVEHQDWKDLYTHFLAQFPRPQYERPWQYGPAYLVHAVTPGGTIAHIGSFHANQGKIELDG